MTNKECIETLKVALAEVERNYPMDYSIAIKQAIEAVEKQIPKKPIIKRCVSWIERRCPNCNFDFGFNTEYYCGNCGQQMSWED